MKTVLCYGDSNTWGFDIESFLAQGRIAASARFAPDVRWPGVLRRELGGGYGVIEEGLNGRTTVFDDPVDGGYKNGRSFLPVCLESHAPLDLVIIMLGTNDVKERFSLTSHDIASGAGALVKIARGSAVGPGGAAPRVLLISPFTLGDTIRSSPFGELFGYERAVEKSRGLAAHYRRVAGELGVPFLDANNFVTAHPLDSIHLSPDSHRALGKAVAGVVRELLGA